MDYSFIVLCPLCLCMYLHSLLGGINQSHRAETKFEKGASDRNRIKQVSARSIQVCRGTYAEYRLGTLLWNTFVGTNASAGSLAAHAALQLLHYLRTLSNVYLL